MIDKLKKNFYADMLLMIANDCLLVMYIEKMLIICGLLFCSNDFQNFV